VRLKDRVAIGTECGRGETYEVVCARAIGRQGAALVVADADLARFGRT